MFADLCLLRILLFLNSYIKTNYRLFNLEDLYTILVNGKVLINLVLFIFKADVIFVG